MINLGTEDESDDLNEQASAYGWDLFIEGLWCNESFPRVHLTDAQMWAWLSSVREAEDKQLADAKDGSE